MDVTDVSVVAMILVISLSGLVINTSRSGKNGRQTVNDAGTLSLFRWAIPSVLVASLVIYFTRFGRITHVTNLLAPGCILVGAGLLVRWLAVWNLGPAFTVKVAIIANHQLRQNGIHRLVRHPSYSGLLLYYLGLGIAMQNWLCLLLLVLVPLFVVLHRIRQEETVLIRHFGDEYRSYILKTWKLIPFIY